MKKHAIIILLGTIFFIFSISCGKMDDIHHHFFEGGEIMYPGKTESLVANPGRYRVELSWTILADPSIKEARVFWNNRRDSLIFPVVRETSPETYSVIIDNLEEKSYTFEVYTYDDEGNRSVRSEAIGMVYGDAYESLLVHRPITSMTYNNDDGTVHIVWRPAEESVHGTEIRYVNSSGQEVTIFAEAEEELTILPDFGLLNNTFSYRTLFIPGENGIDIFYTGYTELRVRYEVALDKSKFLRNDFPNDYAEAHTSDGITFLNLERIWDNIYNRNTAGVDLTVDYTSKPVAFGGPGLPQSFTIDLGVTANLSRIVVFTRTHPSFLYNSGAVKRYTLYGSTNPNPDGSFDDSWSLLRECNSHKPSAQAVGQNSPEDLAYALAGEGFTFPEDAPPVRYLRWVTHENWGQPAATHVTISEIDLYGEILEAHR